MVRIDGPKRTSVLLDCGSDGTPSDFALVFQWGEDLLVKDANLAKFTPGSVHVGMILTHKLFKDANTVKKTSALMPLSLRGVISSATGSGEAPPGMEFRRDQRKAQRL